jgi:hypothetical protein
MAMATHGLGGCDRQSGEMELSAADRELIRENILPKAPNMALPVNADLDGKIIYLGCDIDRQQVSPGDTFTVIHYWKVLDPPGPDWKLFTHLGPKTVNVDRTPIKGKYPVSEWKVGEIIRDEQTVTVPMRWNSPFIIVYVGIFHLGTRIEVRSGETDGANRIVAVRMPVSGTPREAAVPELEARRAWRAPVVDGRLDDPAWAEAPARPMVNAENGGSVFPVTEVKLLWNDDFLFVGVHTADFKRTSQNTLRVLLAHDGAGRAIEVSVSGNGRTDVDLPRLEANGQSVGSGGRMSRLRGKGVRAGVAAVDQPASAAMADPDAANQPPAGESAKTSDKIAGKSAAAPRLGSSGWTAEIAVPWSAFPDGAVPPDVLLRLRANFLRREDPEEGAAIQSAWSPTLGAAATELPRFGVLNLADDVGARLVSRTPPRSPPPQDFPGEMRGLTFDWR